MPPTPLRIVPMRAWVAVAGWATLLLLTVGAFLGALYVGDRKDERRAGDSRVLLCVEIEKLKTGEREDARERFANLDRNLRLLGIAKTPSVVFAARGDRDRALRRYAADDCSKYDSN